MCGIAGFWRGATSSRLNEMDALKSMSDALATRGPDGSGFWTNQDGLFFAHRRLSIIDLSSFGHQPMQSRSGRFHLVFNGEIYNYQSLKKELSSLIPDCVWQGHSDTEVMLAAFEYWGVNDALLRFNGMFACALWDTRDKKLYLMRDRAGEKPLYYGWNQGYFLFASELSALKAHPETQLHMSRHAATLYMHYGYVPTPWSIYEDIFKIPPGCFLALHEHELQQKIVPKPIPYWSLQQVIQDGQRNSYQGSPQQAVDELDTILKGAVRSQMVSDVPIGAFLSGGIDSTTVVALMQSQSDSPIKTFTIGYDNKAYNEADHAALIAKHLGTEHTEWYVSEQDAMSIIPALPAIYAEPFADASQIPTTLVSQLARKKVTVSLSGDAGDELFGGYNRYVFAHAFMKKLNTVPLAVRKLLAILLLKIPVSSLNTLLHCVPGKNKPRLLAEKIHKVGHCIDYTDLQELYQRLVTAPLMQRLLQETVGSFPRDSVSLDRDNPIEWMMAQDFITYLLDDILVKVDRAAMSTSLETRVPFLDPEVISFAWRLPQHMKIQQGVSKWVLREVLYRYVPRSLVERPKMGFGVPIDAWLRGPLHDWAAGLLEKNKLMQHDLFHVDSVQDLWRQHQSKRYNRQQQLWHILMFQSWFEHHF